MSERRFDRPLLQQHRNCNTWPRTTSQLLMASEQGHCFSQLQEAEAGSSKALRSRLCAHDGTIRSVSDAPMVQEGLGGAECKLTTRLHADAVAALLSF